MFKDILIAYDGSGQARRAARLAGEMAREQKADRLWVVVVMEGVSAPAEMGRLVDDPGIEERSTQGEALIDEAVGLVSDGAEIHRELLFGSPAEAIVRVAETRACDLIVMGTRGLSPLEGLLLGSQAQKVISHAPCPVLVVK